MNDIEVSIDVDSNGGGGVSCVVVRVVCVGSSEHMVVIVIVGVIVDGDIGVCFGNVCAVADVDCVIGACVCIV